jgi:hypothetical protein
MEQGPATTIPACEFHGEGSDGMFSSCFYFLPPFQFYLTSFVSSNIVIQSAVLDALPQSIKGKGPTTTIPAHEVCGEGSYSEFCSCFFHYFKCFLAEFFPVKLLFSPWMGFAIFHFHSSPFISILPPLMFQLKFKVCLPKLTISFVNLLHKLDY